MGGAVPLIKMADVDRELVRKFGLEDKSGSKKSVIDAGREALARITSGTKKTREDWVAVGDALVFGKHESKGKKGGFKKWREDNGFGDLRVPDVADSVWLATEGRDFYDYHRNVAHPTLIRVEFRKQKKGGTVSSPPATTAAQVAKKIERSWSVLTTDERREVIKLLEATFNDQPRGEARTGAVSGEPAG